MLEPWCCSIPRANRGHPCDPKGPFSGGRGQVPDPTVSPPNGEGKGNVSARVKQNSPCQPEALSRAVSTAGAQEGPSAALGSESSPWIPAAPFLPSAATSSVSVFSAWEPLIHPIPRGCFPGLGECGRAGDRGRGAGCRPSSCRIPAGCLGRAGAGPPAWAGGPWGGGTSARRCLPGSAAPHPALLLLRDVEAVAKRHRHVSIWP